MSELAHYLDPSASASPDYFDFWSRIDLIGAAAKNAAGKDGLLKAIAAQPGGVYFNTGDFIRKLAVAEFGTTNRGGNLSASGIVANRVREGLYGGMTELGMIAIFKNFSKLHPIYWPRLVGIGSIRSYFEAEYLNRYGLMATVEASEAIRYHRVQSAVLSRGSRVEDTKSLADWREDERQELGLILPNKDYKKGEFSMGAAIEECVIRIDNSSTPEAYATNITRSLRMAGITLVRNVAAYEVI